MQLTVLLTHIAKKYPPPLPFFLLGDLNLLPDSLPFGLLSSPPMAPPTSQKVLTAIYISKVKNSLATWPDLIFPYLSCAATSGGVSTDVSGFRGLIDHIAIRGARVTAAKTLPGCVWAQGGSEAQELIPHCRKTPNELFPSDHFVVGLELMVAPDDPREQKGDC